MTRKVNIDSEVLKDVTVAWSDQYAAPIFILNDGRKYIASTGQWAGYYEQCGGPETTPSAEKEGSNE